LQQEGLSIFPETVKQDIGRSLFVAQEGGQSPAIKTLQGFGGGSVVEVVEDLDGHTYRCV
jgi:phage-related protein